MKHTTDAELQIELIPDMVFVLAVEFTYTPGVPGNTSGPPETCYPAEPPELELYSVRVLKVFRADDPEKSLDISDDPPELPDIQDVSESWEEQITVKTFEYIDSLNDGWNLDPNPEDFQ